MMGRDDDARNIDLEWEKRVLCSDESCIGTIGPDGCCRECGVRCPGALPDGIEGLPDDAFSTPEDHEDDLTDGASDVEPEARGDEALDGDDEWARRTLCLDESCIGVIGKDGRCKECGKPFEKP